MSMYRFNWKFLLGLLAVVGVGGGLLHARYKSQVGKQADTLLALANGADQRGETAKAAGFLRRYLVFRPQDTDSRGRLGLVLARLARQPSEHLQAYFVLDEAVRSVENQADKRPDLRRKAAELALRLGPDLLNDVKRHLDVLLAPPNTPDGELFVLYADYHLVQAQYAEAAEKLRLATKIRAELFSAHVRRARILREKLDQQTKADEVIENMLEPPESAKAFRAQLAAAAYWETDPSAPRPKRDPEQNYIDRLKAANDLAPDELEVILAVADRDLRAAGRAALQHKDDERKKALDGARAALRRGTGRYAPTLQKMTAEEAARLDDEAMGKRALVGLLFQKLAQAETQAGDLAAAETAARDGSTALPESVPLLLALLDVHIRQGKYDPARDELDRLKRAGVPSPITGYHEARILAGRPDRPDWLAAARTLETVLSEPGLPAEFVAPAAVLLGDCYEPIGELDRRYAAYKQAAAAADVRDTLWLTANERLAATLMGMGQVAEAGRILEDLAPRAPGANVPLARVRLVQTLARPEGQRDWAPVEQALTEAQKAAPKGVETDLVWADLHLARGDDGQAAAKLAAAVKEHPDAVRPQLALALTEARRKNPARARELLDAARAKFGNTADVRLTEARLIASAPGPDTAARLARLADGAGQLPPGEARRLLKGLADLAAGAGAADAAAALHDQRAAAAPDDIGAHLSRFDDALARKDFGAANEILGRIRHLDKATGTNTQVAEAFLEIARYQHDKSGSLAVARERLDVVERQRPWWPRAALAQALIADLKAADSALPGEVRWAEKAKAAELYKTAIAGGGEQRPETLQRLLALYAELGLTNAAEEVLSRADAAAAARGSELLVVELSLRSGNLGRAVAFGSKAFSETDTDPKKLIGLSQIRELARESDDRVIAPLRRAVDVAPDRPEGWVHLVRYLARTDRKDQAVAETERAKVRLGNREKLAVAQCLVAVGRPEQARPLYEEVAKERPTDWRALLEVLDFHTRTKNIDADAFKKAEGICEGLLKLPLTPDVQLEVSEIQTNLRLGRPDFQVTRDHLVRAGVLDGAGGLVRLTGRESIPQLRSRAYALARQPDATLRRDAINTLEAIDQRQKLRAEDQFVLAQLLGSVGQWPAARGRLKALTEAADPNPSHVAYYGLRVLLLDDTPNTREARRCLGLLEKSQPAAPTTIELKARLLDAEGNLAGAVEAVKGYVGKDESRAGVGALLLERLGALEPAEALYRTFAGDTKRVGGPLMLAGFLGRQGRTGEAIGLLAERADTLPPALTAGVGVEILYNSPQAVKKAIPQDAIRQVEGWVDRAAKKGLPEADALSLRAVIRVVDGKYEDAIRLYEAAVGKGTPDPLTMNNLGYLLAFLGRTADGLAWVRRARDAAGPRPAILDTEAVIRTAAGEPQKAVELLVDATREDPDPAAFFHLYEAHRAADDPAAAAAAIRQARRWKIRLIDVPPLERPRLEDALRTRR